MHEHQPKMVCDVWEAEGVQTGDHKDGDAGSVVGVDTAVVEGEGGVDKVVMVG